MNEILEQIKALSRGEKLALIRDITLTLEDDELSPEQEAELNEEIAAYERDKDAGESWEVVRARVAAGASQAEVLPRRVAA